MYYIVPTALSKMSKSTKNAPQSCRELRNPDIRKLKDWHPTICGNVYSTDDPNVGRDDLPLPNGPAIKFRPSSLSWRRTLSSRDIIQYNHEHMSQ